LLDKKRRIKMRGTKFLGIGIISTACVLVLLLAVGMGIFPGKAQAANEEPYPAFVTFNEFPGGEVNNEMKIRDDNMDACGPEGYPVSGYSDGTYSYGDGEFEVTAWIRNPAPNRLAKNSFWVFISNKADCGGSESRRTVVLDFPTPQDPAEGDNVYKKAVKLWTALPVLFAVNNKSLPSLLKMEPGATLSGTGEPSATRFDSKLWFNFVVPGLTSDIDKDREFRLDGHGCGLIVFWLTFDFTIEAGHADGFPLNPVDTTLANKWRVTNTSRVTLGITENVSDSVKKGKGRVKEEWKPVELAQYEMPFQLTMVLLASGDSLAPGKYNTLPTLWGKIKAR
jgi:hypothetical protein